MLQFTWRWERYVVFVCVNALSTKVGIFMSLCVIWPCTRRFKLGLVVKVEGKGGEVASLNPLLTKTKNSNN